MNISLSAVVPDSSDSGRAAEQAIYLALYETGEIACTVRDSDGVLYDLSNGALIFTVKDMFSGDALIAREAVVASPSSGIGVFSIGSSDTVNLLAKKYRYDIQFRPTGGGVLQVIPPSSFVLTPAVGIPGEDVTVPDAEQPLGLGPQGQGFTWLGTYNSGTVYEPYDVVSFSVLAVTSSYVCIAESVGNDPTDTDYWNLFASGS